ncbi:MAG: outer membrane lipoprotein-sorting protein [Verrucomicrobiae bacterium]|nr:outer membrane lipoprotein-sorting protein [Verrucomicrobiae bacterium]
MRLAVCVLMMLGPAGNLAEADMLADPVAERPEINPAEELLKRVWSQRPRKDLELRGRLWNAREEDTAITVLAQYRDDETRTVYRTERVELLVIQPLSRPARLYLRGSGELRGAARWATFPGTSIAFADLAMEFLGWAAEPKIGQERVRGRDCYRVETVAAAGHDEPHRRARIWIDREYLAVLRVELIDANDRVARRLAVTSFRRVDDVWIPRQIEIAHIPRGQALPAQERSRMEFLSGNFDATLPAQLFDESQY